MDFQMNIHANFANDRDDWDDRDGRDDRNDQDEQNIQAMPDPVAILQQLYIRHLNYLYSTLHFDNTIDHSEFPPEFIELDFTIHLLVQSIIVSMNGGNGSSQNAHVDVDNVQD